jgi:hypothetical protein
MAHWPFASTLDLADVDNNIWYWDSFEKSSLVEHVLLEVRIALGYALPGKEPPSDPQTYS